MFNPNPDNQIYRGLETGSENIYDIESDRTSHIFDTGILERVEDIAVYTGANGLKQFDSDERKDSLLKFLEEDGNVEEMRRDGLLNKKVAGLEAFLNYEPNNDLKRINDKSVRKDIQLGHFDEQGTADILRANKSTQTPLSVRQMVHDYTSPTIKNVSRRADEKVSASQDYSTADAVSSTWL